MGVLRSDLRRVSLGCQVVSHDVVTDAGRIVTASGEVAENREAVGASVIQMRREG